MKRVIAGFTCFLTALTLVVLSGCSANKSTGINADGNKKLTVYTSFYPMYDFANKVGGDRISLSNLVPAGTEPHDWEPTPGDIKKLQRADVFIYSGAGMEGWVNKILASARNKKLVAVEASKGLELIESGNREENLKYDPHVWLNPRLAGKQMEAIKNALSNADPSNSGFYEKNFSENLKKLEDLDKEYRGAIAECKRKDIVVAHMAFGYLCSAYGLRQMAIEGMNAEAEPTPAKMAGIADYAKKNNVKVIFFEELISPKVAEVIAKEAGAVTEVLNPLEGLRDGDIKAGKEYFSVMKDNLRALKKALM